MTSPKSLKIKIFYVANFYYLDYKKNVLIFYIINNIRFPFLPATAN